jgi:hypothetical protein
MMWLWLMAFEYEFLGLNVVGIHWPTPQVGRIIKI